MKFGILNNKFICTLLSACLLNGISISPGSNICYAENIKGSARYDVALEDSKSSNKSNMFKNVVITDVISYIDELCANSFARNNNAELLLSSNEIPSYTLDEIDNISPEHIVIIGDTYNISSDVEKQLQTMCSKEVLRYGIGGQYENKLEAINFHIEDKLLENVEKDNTLDKGELENKEESKEPSEEVKVAAEKKTEEVVQAKDESDTQSVQEEKNQDTPVYNEPTDTPAKQDTSSKEEEKAPQKESEWTCDINASQVIEIVGKSQYSTSGVLTIYNKSENGWSKLRSVNCYLGEGGLGKTKEGQPTTPVGVFKLGRAFGICDSPNCSVNYTKVDDSYYWVDDSNSQYYNKLVSTRDTGGIKWNSGEHIASCTTCYRYAVDTGYNSECTPGKGSAIFIHCTQYKPTQGCISIEESEMIYLLQNIRNDTMVYIHY